jgi:ribonuclease D
MVVYIVDDEYHQKHNTQAANGGFYDAVQQAIEKSSRVAFDCEGVNLCRAGSIELISLCIEGHTSEVYLVDVSLKTAGGGVPTFRANRVAALKTLFEADNVLKIIHDCRMDCDALYHLLGIQLTNVHDTSSYHYAINGQEDKGLNDVLERHNIRVNTVRDKTIYRRDPAFWSRRPLTRQMIDWASSDVDKLLELATQQDMACNMNPGRKAVAQQHSIKYTTVVRDMQLQRGLKVMVPIGRFIGTGGTTLRSLQKRTNTMIYQDHDLYESNKWLVFYQDASSLALVKRAMGN